MMIPKTSLAGLFRKAVCLVFAALVAFGVECRAEEPASPLRVDLVVVGATPGGIACAVSAAREGLDVLLVQHTNHIGGFMTSGCGGWEAPYDGARSPVFDEVKRRISEYYKKTYGENSQQYRASIPDSKSKSHKGRPRVEPRVAEQIFEQMVGAEKRITLWKGFYVESADRNGDTLRSLVFRKTHGNETRTAAAKVFADCTYEGDLAAAARVPYKVGREARAEYNEPHAGVIFTKGLDAKSGKPPIELNLRRLGPIHGLKILPESTGEGDASVMTYNFRLILTKDPANRVPVQKPENYQGPTPNAKASILDDLPNKKIAWNGGGRLIGPQSEYPEANWAKREEISRKHLDAVLSQLWFYQNDPSAPKEQQEFWKDYGLAKDEFPDNGNVPYEIYVREARRLVGRHVFTEHDGVLAPGLMRTPVFPDSIAVTDWPIDSTVCTTRTAGKVQEGKFQVADIWAPGQVPYRSLLPKGVDNLLVPVCLSATHVGWGTIRLEPVWMQTGEAAGLAAALAVRGKTSPSALSADLLIQRLAERGHMVSFFNDVDLASGAAWNPAVQYLGTRGFFGSYDAKPNDPLTTETAKAWAGIFAKVAAKDPAFDATAEAAASYPNGTGGAPSVTGQAFIELLKEALRSKTQALQTLDAATRPLKTPGATLSRAEACMLMYQALKKL